MDENLRKIRESNKSIECFYFGCSFDSSMLKVDVLNDVAFRGNLMVVLYSLTSRSLHNHADDESNGREEFYAIQENFMFPRKVLRLNWRVL